MKYSKEEIWNFVKNLDERQRKIVLSLYEKNDEVFDTINYKILDEKYAQLEDKLLLLTSYEEDIQEKICRLNENAYNIFVTAMKKQEEKSGEWVEFTDKFILNLYTGEYNRLIRDIENKQLSQEQIEKIGYIIAEENIFNIESLEDVNNNEKTKETICDEIMRNPNSEELEDYPEIYELSPLERMKFAVCMKVYGQHLTQVNRLIKLYGEDIDNLELNDKNKSVVKYIQSLKIIGETDDEELLKRIYEKSKTIQLDSIYDVKFIERRLKDSYQENYNQKLYQPKEEDLIGVEEVNGKQIPIYDVGTEFSISLTSVGSTSNELANYIDGDYKKTWNRPKTKSQRYCASQIRNDMASTHRIMQVLYGFKHHEEGTLMASGPEDLGTVNWSFRPRITGEEKYCTENTQINQTGGVYETNEMDYSRRLPNGEIQQPDYIVFINGGNYEFLESNEEMVWKNSLKAASDFGIPIVVVDRKKCAISEKQKISKMIDEFLESRDKKILIDIFQKFSNNQLGNEELFNYGTWHELWNEKGISKPPRLLDRHQLLQVLKDLRSEYKKDKRVSVQDFKENYDKVDKEEQDKAMKELQDSINLVIDEYLEKGEE